MIINISIIGFSFIIENYFSIYTKIIKMEAFLSNNFSNKLFENKLCKKLLIKSFKKIQKTFGSQYIFLISFFISNDTPETSLYFLNYLVIVILILYNS